MTKKRANILFEGERKAGKREAAINADKIIRQELTQQPIKFVDATPDEGYPLRILRAYRQECDCMWVESTTEEKPSNPLLKIMNGHNRQRARILDKAIIMLETEGRNDPWAIGLKD